MTPLPKIVFIAKGRANRNPPCCPFPALLTPLAVIAFIDEEATGCINEESIGAINEAVIGAYIVPTQQIHLLVFIFYVLLFQ